MRYSLSQCSGTSHVHTAHTYTSHALTALHPPPPRLSQCLGLLCLLLCLRLCLPPSHQHTVNSALSFQLRCHVEILRIYSIRLLLSTIVSLVRLSVPQSLSLSASQFLSLSASQLFSLSASLPHSLSASQPLSRDWFPDMGILIDLSEGASQSHRVSIVLLSA